MSHMELFRSLSLHDVRIMLDVLPRPAQQQQQKTGGVRHGYMAFHLMQFQPFAFSTRGGFKGGGRLPLWRAVWNELISQPVE